jgi:type II secretory pathway component PulK
MRRAQRRGVALLIVLGLIVLLATLAISFHDQMQARLFDSKMAAMDAEALALARSGVDLTRLLLKAETRQYLYLHHKDTSTLAGTDKKKIADHTKLDEIYEMLAKTSKDGFPMGKGKLAINLSDESGRINLNRADEALLGNLFASVGLKRRKKLEIYGETVDEDISREAARSVINWRSPEGQKLPNGATDAYYQSLKPPYKARNAPFEAVEELLLIKDITPVAYFGSSPDEAKEPDPKESPKDAKKLDGKSATAAGASSDATKKKKVVGVGKFFTVFGDGRININNAPREVLRVLPGLAETPAREIIIQALLDRRPIRDLGEIQGMMGQVDPKVTARIQAALKTGSNTLRVQATGIYGKRRRTVEAVLGKNGNTIKIYYYRED